MMRLVNGYDPVSGYLQLDMAEDALLELKSMSAAKQKTERYNELLLAAQMMHGAWKDAAETAQWLCKKDDSENSYFIHAAFCLHESGDTKAALNFLMDGPKPLRKEPLFHYNLACYHAMLDQPVSAMKFLKKSFKLDPDLVKVAEKDKDLEGLVF